MSNRTDYRWFAIIRGEIWGASPNVKARLSPGCDGAERELMSSEYLNLQIFNRNLLYILPHLQICTQSLHSRSTLNGYQRSAFKWIHGACQWKEIGHAVTFSPVSKINESSASRRMHLCHLNLFPLNILKSYQPRTKGAFSQYLTKIVMFYKP